MMNEYDTNTSVEEGVVTCYTNKEFNKYYNDKLAKPHLPYWSIELINEESSECRCAEWDSKGKKWNMTET